MKSTTITEVPATAWKILPPAKDKCQVCAGEHEPHYPHVAESIYFQMKFKIENGRDVTWADAMSHCDDEMKTAWTHALARHGVDVNSINIRGTR